MDSTRISLARILEANVPLTWQDAVAVVQEVAMVSDVNAAMNSSPSLVTAASCFLTTDGEVDLPEIAEEESPAAVGELLRMTLRGRDAPPALLALARRRHTDDLFGELAAFSTEQRRPVIAALAVRALAPQEPAAVAPPAAPTPPIRPPAPVTPSAPLRSETEPPRLPLHPIPPPFVATPPTVVLAPPFRAAEPVLDATAAPDAHSPELELRRLRARTVGQDHAGRAWPARLAAWLSRRPAFPDPRLLGGAVIVIAAVTSLVWRDGVPALLRSSSPPPVATPSSSAPSAPATDVAPAAVPAATSAANAPPVRPTAPAAPPGVARPEPRATGTRPAAAVTPPPVAANGDARRAAESSPTPSTATPAPPVPSTGTPGPTSILIPALDPPRPAPRPPGRESARSRTSYSAQDANVTPPVMLRQQLPSPLLEPGAEVQPGGPYLELLVDEQGAVEQVRLRARQPAPGQTWYRHRMLLAAAKAWQFEPARLDGQPVRYVMRVPLEP